MRSASTKDYWRKLEDINIPVRLQEINLNGNNGIDKLSLGDNLFAICGLNGAGKSTILSAIKDLIGLDLSEKDSVRLSKSIEGTILLNQVNEVKVENTKGSRLVDTNDIQSHQMLYLDYEQSITIINKINNQENLEELLEQYDEYEFDRKELDDISYIIGKDYDKVAVKELDDYDEFSLPFFIVECDNVQYNSLNMGVGEHLLFYYFIMLKKINNNGIVLIEEPESFISVRSQERFMNYMAKKIVKSKINLIVTTHSPFIIKNIPAKNLILVNRFGENTSIHNGQERHIIRSLGLEQNKRGIIYVEDQMAENLLRRVLKDGKKSYILNDYDIKSVGGEGNITNRLKSTCTEINFNIVGLYDADMKSDVEKRNLDSILWKYEFLPGKRELEIEFKECVRNNIDLLADKTNIDRREIITVLSEISGDNYHDWFMNLAKKLYFEQNQLFNIIYDLWIMNEGNSKTVKQFLSNISYIIV